MAYAMSVPVAECAYHARTYGLRQHGLVIVLQPVREDQNRHEPLVDLADQDLLLPLRPVQVSFVRREHFHGFILVERVNVLASFSDRSLDSFLSLVVAGRRRLDLAMMVADFLFSHAGLDESDPGRERVSPVTPSESV